MFNRILVAFDDSTHAHKALKLGYEIAKTYNAHLHIVTVIHLPDYAGTIDEVDEIIKEGKKFYQKAMDEVVAEAEKSGIKVSAKMLYGHIGETLIKYERENTIDLIITGSHGRSTVGKLLLGSVSDYIAKHARCPVLIVRE
ncbi:MAG: universal stress protein [Peptococcaceae bacterium]|nr:universal stress protein [Peptococcaceae bacterium]